MKRGEKNRVSIKYKQASRISSPRMHSATEGSNDTGHDMDAP